MWGEPWLFKKFEFFGQTGIDLAKLLKSITLKFGPNGPSAPLILPTAALTVFVGPNGSGKSLILRELEQYASLKPQSGGRIVEALELKYPTREEALQLLRSRIAPLDPLSPVPAGHLRLSKMTPAFQSTQLVDVNEVHLLTHLEKGRLEQQGATEPPVPAPWVDVYSQFLFPFTLSLDGRNRFALTDACTAGDLLRDPPNHLSALFKNDAARAKVREIILDAFGYHFVIDPTQLGYFRIRLAARAPSDPDEEQAFSERARRFHASAYDIQDMSDGVKAFTGLVSALISSDYRIMLVDEPEAFLHPPLARKLGYRMATLAAERGGNLFTATHSSDFLIGCVESGKPVSIVRLTYEENRPTARTLASAELTSLMRDPLLRSTNVLSALFHRGAVICEADSDRAFYQEINHRILSASEPGVRDAVFLNAQNKQTVRRITEPLRRLGIPAAAVVDFDIFKGNDLKDLLHACSVPQGIVNSLGMLRGQIESYYTANGLTMGKGGISLLSDMAQKESCQSLLLQLEAYGIFVVPKGGLESWMAGLGIVESKHSWLPKVFEAMGSDPDDPSYALPVKDEDVWLFMQRVGSWVSNPLRLGMY